MNTQPPDSSASELFLIAHKVRGEPAFDIATRVLIGEEEGWIIPTSGHRAYPYWHRPFGLCLGIETVPDCPQDWPDHYATSAAPSVDLITALGIKPKATTISRR